MVPIRKEFMFCLNGTLRNNECRVMRRPVGGIVWLHTEKLQQSV